MGSIPAGNARIYRGCRLLRLLISRPNRFAHFEATLRTALSNDVHRAPAFGVSACLLQKAGASCRRFPRFNMSNSVPPSVRLRAFSCRRVARRNDQVGAIDSESFRELTQSPANDRRKLFGQFPTDEQRQSARKRYQRDSLCKTKVQCAWVQEAMLE